MEKTGSALYKQWEYFGYFINDETLYNGKITNENFEKNIGIYK